MNKSAVIATHNESKSTQPVMEPKIICLDLDGTLLKVDSLHELLIAVLRKAPLKLPAALLAITKGKARFKDTLMRHAGPFGVEYLPYNQEVLDYVKSQKQAGKKVALVTGAHQQIADKVKAHLGFIDEAHGTSKALNLVSGNKAAFIEKHFPGCEYIADSKKDLPVWQSTSKATYVGNNSRLAEKVKSINNNFYHIQLNRPGKFKTFIKAIRVHQWAKNLLVFAALFLSHQYTDTGLIANAVQAFAAFSMIASSVYLFNDIMDIESDRKHPTKRYRPIAAGLMNPVFATAVSIVFLLSGITIAALVNVNLLLNLLIYFVITTAYSFGLKKLAILDVVLLAGLFTLRLLAGHFACEIFVSPWIIAFSIFIFTSLACLKRFSELLDKKSLEESTVFGRGYTVTDINIVSQIGVSTGLISTMIIALYVNSSAVLELYTKPYFLWGICPVLVFWIGRMWVLGQRGLVKDDPVLYVIKDKVSYVVGLFCVVLILLAK